MGLQSWSSMHFKVIFAICKDDLIIWVKMSVHPSVRPSVRSLGRSLLGCAVRTTVTCGVFCSLAGCSPGVTWLRMVNVSFLIYMPRDSSHPARQSDDFVRPSLVKTGRPMLDAGALWRTTWILNSQYGRHQNHEGGENRDFYSFPNCLLDFEL